MIMLSLEEKLKIIYARWPNLKAILDEKKADDLTFTGDTPTGVLVYKGLHISSAFDPLKEAEVQAAGFCDVSGEVWLYGVGSGHLIDRVLSFHSIKKVNVVFFNSELFTQSLSYYMHNWIVEKKVALHYAAEFMYPSYPFVCVHAELMVPDTDAVSLRDRVIMDLNENLRCKKLNERFTRFDFPNINKNLTYFHSDPDVSRIFNTIKSGLIVVAAAGETLSEFITNPVKCDCLIAVSTALKPLLTAGIEPDYVVVVDSHPGVFKHFEGLDYESIISKCSLVYTPNISSEILKKWHGSRYSFIHSKRLVGYIPADKTFSTLFSSGTVTHSAIDLASKIGASDILLVGTDFAYVNGFSHSEGSAFRVEKKSLVTIQSFNGDSLKTSESLISYLRDLEFYIMKNTGLSFYTFSLNGAKINGVQKWISDDTVSQRS